MDITEPIVKPKPVKIPLTDGHYLVVKRRLNAGEALDLLKAMHPQVTPGEPMRFDPKAAMTAKPLTYLLGWSLKTDEGVPIPMAPVPEMSDEDRCATLLSIPPEDFNEIRAAVDAHEDAVEQEIAALKKTPAGSPSPEAL